jgi:hypothetical protein
MGKRLRRSSGFYHNRLTPQSTFELPIEIRFMGRVLVAALNNSRRLHLDRRARSTYNKFVEFEKLWKSNHAGSSAENIEGQQNHGRSIPAGNCSELDKLFARPTQRRCRTGLPPPG